MKRKAAAPSQSRIWDTLPDYRYQLYTYEAQISHHISGIRIHRLAIFTAQLYSTTASLLSHY